MKNKFVLALLSTIISVSYCKSHADNNIVDNINQNGTITIILPDELNNRVNFLIKNYCYTRAHY